MRNILYRRWLLLVPLLAALAAGGVGIHTTQAQTSAVTIQNFAFNPSTITVQVGTTVTWTNQDSAPHTATSDTGVTPAFDTGTLNMGQSGSVTFTTPGTYTYHCRYHQYMQGTVIVQAAASSPTAAPAASATPAATSTVAPTASAATATPAPTSTPEPSPTPSRPTFSLHVKGRLIVGTTTTLSVTVVNADSGKAVSKAGATLDGRKVGIGLKRGKTNGKGVVTFKGLHPTRTGTVKLTVSKSGFGRKVRSFNVKGHA